MEDMDTQLRSQLEKIISQRNQLSAEKAASDIEVSTAASGCQLTSCITCVFDLSAVKR